MSKSPAFQFYPQDFLSDLNVLIMSNQEKGCYITLLCHCWIHGSIPNDLAKLAKICSERLSTMKRLWENLKICFSDHLVKENELINSRIEHERDKQRKHSEEKSKAGIAGMSSRWLSEKTTAKSSVTLCGKGYKGIEMSRSDYLSVITLLCFCYNKPITLLCFCYKFLITNDNSSFSFSSSSSLKEILITNVINTKKEKSKKLKIPVDNFLPTDAHRTQAAKLGLDVELEAEKFKDRNIARGETYVNLDAAFRNWLRLACEYKLKGAARGPYVSPKPVTPSQLMWGSFKATSPPAAREETGEIYVIN